MENNGKKQKIPGAIQVEKARGDRCQTTQSNADFTALQEQKQWIRYLSSINSFIANTQTRLFRLIGVSRTQNSSLYFSLYYPFPPSLLAHFVQF